MASACQASGKKHWPFVYRRQTTKDIDPSPMTKIDICSGLGKGRRTSRATSRALDHGPTFYFGGRDLYLLALPDTKRVGRGLILGFFPTKGISDRFDAKNRYKYKSHARSPGIGQPRIVLVFGLKRPGTPDFVYLSIFQLFLVNFEPISGHRLVHQHVSYDVS